MINNIKLFYIIILWIFIFRFDFISNPVALLNFLSWEKKIFKNYNFWSNRIVFENLKFNAKNKNVHDKICVIIPARNEEKTILKTLKSLKDQKINNLEIIVIDDNSTDNTSKIVNNFKKNSKKSFFFRVKNFHKVG